MTRICTLIEFQKIMWRKKYIVLIILCGLFAALYGVLGAIKITIGNDFTITLPDVMFSILTPMNRFVLPLLIFMLASDIFTQEIENKSIKCMITRPVSRFTVYSSKLLAIMLYSAVILGVVYAVTGVFQIFSGGLANLPAAFLAYAVSLLPLLGFAATAAAISVIIPSPSLSMFISILLYVFMLLAGLIWWNVGAVMFASYWGWYKMWLGTLHWGNIAGTFSLIASYTVLVFILGEGLFERKDV